MYDVDIIRCIYAIWNTEDEAAGVYVGRTDNFFDRWSKHQHLLKNGTHHNLALQGDLGLLQPPVTMDIIEEVPANVCISERERYWRDRIWYSMNPVGCPTDEFYLDYILARLKRLERDYRKEYFKLHFTGRITIIGPQRKRPLRNK